MPIYDALYDGGVEHLLCRHEQGAAMAAIGYARATGKTGVCMATSGPGATNLITGLADALLDSVPVVAITGQVASPFIGTDAFGEVDVLGLSLACTKHSFLVQSLEELPRVMAEAFEVASSGRLVGSGRYPERYPCRTRRTGAALLHRWKRRRLSACGS